MQMKPTFLSKFALMSLWLIDRRVPNAKAGFVAGSAEARKKIKITLSFRPASKAARNKQFSVDRI
jgi:hypothetical protein